MPETLNVYEITLQHEETKETRVYTVLARDEDEAYYRAMSLLTMDLLVAEGAMESPPRKPIPIFH